MSAGKSVAKHKKETSQPPRGISFQFKIIMLEDKKKPA